MSLKTMKKEELDLLSNKDITELLLKENKRQYKTLDLFKKIIKLKGLPEDTIDKKIADYYMQLSTDKRFILLDNGKWDLRCNHTSDKIAKASIEDDDEEESEEEIEEDLDIEDSYDDDDDADDYSDEADDIKDLVIVDEDELDQEN